MEKTRHLLLLLFVLLVAAAFAKDFQPASDTFAIPETPPDMIITANTMTVRDGNAILEGNVKATRANDILTCNRALVSNSPRWLLASMTPRLFRREALPVQKIIRETNLEARNIFYDSDNGRFSASDSVHLRIEERSWDLATYTWAVITSDEMLGFRDSSRMIFSGNVKVRDQENYGYGNRLDYLKEKSLAILSGNAVLETREKNAKTGKMEPRVLKGQKIIYNTETRQAVSE
ncbi:MAG TPA: LptA/OstA family protein [Candidatus Rifleibacterium sp.]|jgi:lipopolysaccharide export system protein LptA|nr:LptA/OstA family protein [Candidatus Rifleibacterium sp.]